MKALQLFFCKKYLHYVLPYSELRKTDVIFSEVVMISAKVVISVIECNCFISLMKNYV